MENGEWRIQKLPWSDSPGLLGEAWPSCLFKIFLQAAVPTCWGALTAHCRALPAQRELEQDHPIPERKHGGGEVPHCLSYDGLHTDFQPGSFLGTLGFSSCACQHMLPPRSPLIPSSSSHCPPKGDPPQEGL